MFAATRAACARILALFAVASAGCGAAIPPPERCVAGRTLLDGVCVSEAVADYVACVRAQGAELDARSSQELSAEAGYVGLRARAASDVRETLQRKYSTSEAAMLAIVERCGRVAPSAPTPTPAPAPLPASTVTRAPASGQVLETWSLASAMDAPKNPAGPWSLGYRREVTGALTLFPQRGVDEEGNPIWRDPANNAYGVPSMWRRVVGAPRFGIPVGAVAMHPGCTYGELAVARFAAPVAGDYRLSAEVGAGDVGAVDLVVLVDGVPKRHDRDVRTAWSAELGPLRLAAGAAIELGVGVGSDRCGSDNVPVTLVITRVSP